MDSAEYNRHSKMKIIVCKSLFLKHGLRCFFLNSVGITQYRLHNMFAMYGRRAAHCQTAVMQQQHPWTHIT